MSKAKAAIFEHSALVAEAVNDYTMRRMAYVNANREALVEAWLAEHDCPPSEAVLCTRDDWEGSKCTTRCWIERRK